MALLELLLEYSGTLLVLGLILLTISWIRYVKDHFYVFHHLGIPGPTPSFLFGNALDFSKTFPLDLYSRWCKQYGHIFGYYEGMKPSLVVTCPELAKEILVKHFRRFSSRPKHIPFLWELEERSLQHSNGLLWKRQRQAVSGGMSGRCIREMFPIIHDVTDELMMEIERSMEDKPGGFIIDGLIERYTVDIMSQAALGYPSNALKDKNNTFLRYMQAAHESGSPESFASGFARLFPLLTSLLRPLDRKHKVWAQRMRKTVEDFVDIAKEEPSRSCPIMRSLCTHATFKSDPSSQAKNHENYTNHTCVSNTKSKPTAVKKANSDKLSHSHSTGASNTGTQLETKSSKNIKNGYTNSALKNNRASEPTSKKYETSISSPQPKTENSQTDSSSRSHVFVNKSAYLQNSTKNVEQEEGVEHKESVHSAEGGRQKSGALAEDDAENEEGGKRKSGAFTEEDTGLENEEKWRHKGGSLTEEDAENEEGGKQKGGSLTEEEVIGEIMGLLAAGLGPLSAAITFVIYCLVAHADERVKVEKEIEKVIGHNKDITLEELKKLETLERFIFESIRTYPVAPGVSRECVEDCVISGHKFTEGMVVRIMSNVMYKNDDNFEHSDKFIPDRFKDRCPSSAWMPFGQGPRKCVADRLALAVLKLCTARILQRFQLSVAEGTQIPLQLALRPFLVPRDGVCVHFTNRTPLR